jgi:hypothetical protein
MMKELTLPFMADVDTSFVWEYVIKHGSTDPIHIYPDLSQFNPNYTIRISINGDDFYLHNEEGMTYQPTNMHDIHGEIEIFNYTVGNDDVVNIPAKFSVYPNPFNPETNIAFSVKQQGDVELSLYNIRGQKVTTLIKEEMKAGNHNIVWAGTDKYGRSVASGVYFARLKVNGNKTRVKKLMLMK